MTWIEAFILGIIQGIGEPILVSSSAQTMIASFFMKVETPGILFEVFLNFASFLAILWLTRKDVYQIIKGSYTCIVFKGKKSLPLNLEWLYMLSLEPFLPSYLVSP